MNKFIIKYIKANKNRCIYHLYGKLCNSPFPEDSFIFKKVINFNKIKKELLTNKTELLCGLNLSSRYNSIVLSLLYYNLTLSFL